MMVIDMVKTLIDDVILDRTKWAFIHGGSKTNHYLVHCVTVKLVEDAERRCVRDILDMACNWLLM